MNWPRRALADSGVTVPPLGLGGGGHRRLGSTAVDGADRARRLIDDALDAGIDFIDTAPTYGTEELIGAALSKRAEPAVVATKIGPRTADGSRLTPRQLEDALQWSLRALRRERIELYQLHGLRLDDYDYACNELLPVLQRQRQRGLIAAIGVTEAFESDPTHAMLERAVSDDGWDSVMVGFNWLNTSARDRILPMCHRRGIAVLVMFAVRQALATPAALHDYLGFCRDAGVAGIPLPEEIDDCLASVLADGDSLADLSYRFAAHEPGVCCVLSGTSSPDHLAANIASARRGSVTGEQARRLQGLCGRRSDLTGQSA